MLRPDPEAEAKSPSPKPETIGVIGTPRGAEIAYMLRYNYWGKGYMSEAIKMFLEMWWGLASRLLFVQVDL